MKSTEKLKPCALIHNCQIGDFDNLFHRETVSSGHLAIYTALHTSIPMKAESENHCD